MPVELFSENELHHGQLKYRESHDTASLMLPHAKGHGCAHETSKNFHSSHLLLLVNLLKHADENILLPYRKLSRPIIRHRLYFQTSLPYGPLVDLIQTSQERQSASKMSVPT